MKKMLKGLLVAVLAVSSQSATTNKTFLMPRSQGVNLAMEYATYNELVQHNNGDFFGANFQVVPFYMESSDKSNIGKYFGINNKNVIKLGTAAQVAANPATADFDYKTMIHDVNAQHDAAGTLTFEPELQAYGARIDYYQDLEKILDGLYLKIALPIVHVDNDMHMTIKDTTNRLNTNSPTNTYKYFDGTFGNGTPANTAKNQVNSQDILKYAKRTGSHSETSVADIDVILGYKLLEKDNYYVALNFDELR